MICPKSNSRSAFSGTATSRLAWRTVRRTIVNLRIESSHTMSPLGKIINLSSSDRYLRPVIGRGRHGKSGICVPHELQPEKEKIEYKTGSITNLNVAFKILLASVLFTSLRM